MRDDSIHLLEALRGRIPNILAATWELGHLSEAGARDAILNPLPKWNRRHRSQVDIDLSLLDGPPEPTLLDELRLRAARPGGPAKARGAVYEAMLLQLVMTRLWEELDDSKRGIIDPALFKRIGGVSEVLSDLVRQKMQELEPEEQEVAADIVHYMVTPSGGKIAYSNEDLAAKAERPTLAVLSTMRRLASGQRQLLRRVNTTDADDRGAAGYGGIGGPRGHEFTSSSTTGWRVRSSTGAAASRNVRSARYRPVRRPLRGGRSADLLWPPVAGGQGGLRRALESHFISRNQYLLLRYFELIELRSRNGTTLNCRPVRLGRAETLKSGDLVVLANLCPMSFVGWADIVRGTWGDETEDRVEPLRALLLEGAGRTAQAISDGSTWLQVADGRLGVSREPSGDVCARIDWSEADGVFLEVLRPGELTLIHFQEAYIQPPIPLEAGPLMIFGPGPDHAPKVRTLFVARGKIVAEGAVSSWHVDGGLPFKFAQPTGSLQKETAGLEAQFPGLVAEARPTRRAASPTRRRETRPLSGRPELRPALRVQTGELLRAEPDSRGGHVLLVNGVEVRLRPNGVTWKLRVGCVCGIVRILALERHEETPRPEVVPFFTASRSFACPEAPPYASSPRAWEGSWDTGKARWGVCRPDSRVLEVALLLVAVVGGLLLLSGRAAAIRMLAG